jgi:hypothetical protein
MADRLVDMNLGAQMQSSAAGVTYATATIGQTLPSRQ